MNWVVLGLLCYLALGVVMLWGTHLRLREFEAQSELRLEEHADQAMELARSRHPASRAPRCPRCQAPIVGPAAEHLCSASPGTEA